MKEIDYYSGSRNLKNGLYQFCSQIDPQTDLYVFGSFGRRLAIAQSSSIDNFLEQSLNNRSLRPKTNHRGKYDIDIAIPENQIDWDKLTIIVKQIQLTNKHIDIDPHIIACKNNKLFVSGFLNSKAKKNNLDPFTQFQCINVLVADNFAHLKPLTPESQLLYLFKYSTLRSKDIPEVFLLLSNIYNNNSEIKNLIYTMTFIIEKFSSINWNNMDQIDRIKFWYRLIFPTLIRSKIAIIRHKDSDWYLTTTHYF